MPPTTEQCRALHTHLTAALEAENSLARSAAEHALWRVWKDAGEPRSLKVGRVTYQLKRQQKNIIVVPELDCIDITRRGTGKKSKKQGSKK